MMNSLRSCFNRTFMELKVVPVVLHDDRVTFQSHLYGIESACQSRYTATLVLFQSHLYGIESQGSIQNGANCSVSIAPLWNWKYAAYAFIGIGTRFNRTFMELKARLYLAIAGSVNLFQSHLYGIERAQNISSSQHFEKVSIAPLWNWKRAGLWLLEFVVVFQSHLYGIESRERLLGDQALGVSIAPLWNWKPLALMYWPLSYHVSIAPLWNWKVYPRCRGLKQYAVSIAPLWNWKKRDLTNIRLCVCFNRTFMELKGQHVLCAFENQTFQSHLYGIESIHRPRSNK